MRWNEEEQYYEVDPVEQHPSDFIDDKMKSLFNMIEDTKLEMRGYSPAELDELKEHARSYMNRANRAMVVFASLIVDQCDYQKAILRAAQASRKERAEKKRGWLDRPQPREYR